MKRPLFARARPAMAALVLVAALVVAGARPVAADEIVYALDYPDPTIVRSTGGYFAFATNGGGGNVQVMTSPDLRTWTRLPDALPQLPSWAAPDFTWAPAVVERPSGAVLFFTARHRSSGLQCIGRATALRIQGPYRDTSAQPIVCQMDRGGSIDPAVVVSASGAVHLLFKSEGVVGREPPHIWSVPLTADGRELAGTPRSILHQDQAWEFPIVEGPAMVEAAGYHWLFFAGNKWETGNYAIGVARCNGPAGPCTKWGAGPVLRSSGSMAGPGSPDTVVGPDGQLRLTYHAWDAAKVGYSNGGRRTVRAATLRFSNGFPIVGDARPPAPDGYRLVAADGGVFSYGASRFHGSTGSMTLNRPIVGMATTPSNQGYWLVASDGGIFAFGDAVFRGSTGGSPLNRPIVGMARTPTGDGYWLVASDGGIFAFGDAGFFGSTGSKPLNRPIVGMAPTPTGRGYWLVASDGGIFTFGDAAYFGSTGGTPLNAPIVGMMAMPWGDGYWLVATDGGVFTFGAAPFRGSTGGQRLNRPIVAAAPSPTGAGYWFTGSDGGVFAMGDAPFIGSTGSTALNSPIVGISR